MQAGWVGLRYQRGLISLLTGRYVLAGCLPSGERGSAPPASPLHPRALFAFLASLWLGNLAPNPTARFTPLRAAEPHGPPNPTCPFVPASPFTPQLQVTAVPSASAAVASGHDPRDAASRPVAPRLAQPARQRAPRPAVHGAVYSGRVGRRVPGGGHSRWEKG
jgi:hypothetical protein